MQVQEKDTPSIQRLLENDRQALETAVADAFTRYAIDNRGKLTSPRQGTTVAAALVDLVISFVAKETSPAHIGRQAVSWAEQGMAMITLSAMCRALNTAVSPTIRQHERLQECQVLLLEKLAAAREMLQQRTQEQAQTALQKALHHQLEQQISSHEAQKRQNETLNRILQLTARLSLETEEAMLLMTAIHGVQEALAAGTVSLYGYDTDTDRWVLRISTDENGRDHTKDLSAYDHLHQAVAEGGELVMVESHGQEPDSLTFITILQTGSRILGGMIIKNDQADVIDSEAYLIMIRTFAQNLSTQWRNLFLISETQQRNKEMEILHGRYLDSIWNNEHAFVQADFKGNDLHVNRQTAAATPPSPSATTIPLNMGDYVFGEIELPDYVHLSQEDEEFVDVLVREMGSALNNAHFLQTARAYSNQLQVAAEVSRAVTTILDRDVLIRDVVDLLQTRFNLYYVGLFLVNREANTAVLQAGTGAMGKELVAKQYTLTVDEHSMVGTAIITRRPRVEQDVSRATAYVTNPYLPETRSELALPLRTRSYVLGALTIHSRETGAFSQEGITVMQSLADQLAIAIENAGLFDRTQQNLAESTRLYEAGRRINAALTPAEIYQVLIDFARESNLVDLAQVFAPDPTSPDHFISPAFWSREGIEHDPEMRFARDRMPFSERLTENKLIRIENGQTDPDIDPVTRKLFVNNNIYAATLVPIHVEDEWLGTLALDRNTPVLLTGQELRPFITLADQAAIILSNQQLLRQTETLYHIGRLLDQAITRDDVLEITTREVADYIGAVQCRFVLYDARENVGTVAAEYGTTGFKGQVQFPMRGDYVYEQMQQQQPLLLTADSEAIPSEVREQHVTAFDVQASLLIPAANQQEVMGYLAIDSRRGTRPFSSTHVIFAQTVIDQLVTQIENLNLLDEALQRAQQLITLNQIQTNISHYLQTDQLARAIYEQVSRLMDNTLFTLARYHPYNNHFEPILHIVEGTEVEQEMRILQPDEPMYALLQQNMHLLTDGDNPLAHAENTHLTQIPQSGLWIPMRREGTTTGLISVQSYQPDAYDENDVQLLRSIATQANLAIANAELFERIQAHNEELMQLDLLKNQFLANMSHELRTPLNSIIGFSRVILKGIDGPITPEQEEDLTSIYTNGQHLLNLINEILDMAKIEAGKMTLAFEEVNLGQAAETVRNTVRGLLDPEKVELVWQVEPDLPPIQADPIRIRQILLNLLSNAAKYTFEGQIELKMEQVEEHIHVSVRDSGIGIAQEDFDKVFAAFEQADSSTTRAVGGTGLGLPITKWLVEMHQGRIYFESKLNVGTTFHIILPLEQTETGDEEDQTAETSPASA